MNKNDKLPAPNMRFYESGGVNPQTVLCKFASASPARTFVSPRLHKAAGTLAAMLGRQHSVERVNQATKREC